MGVSFYAVENHYEEFVSNCQCRKLSEKIVGNYEKQTNPFQQCQDIDIYCHALLLSVSYKYYTILLQEKSKERAQKHRKSVMK